MLDSNNFFECSRKTKTPQTPALPMANAKRGVVMELAAGGFGTVVALNACPAARVPF